MSRTSHMTLFGIPGDRKSACFRFSNTSLQPHKRRRFLTISLASRDNTYQCTYSQKVCWIMSPISVGFFFKRIPSTKLISVNKLEHIANGIPSLNFLITFQHIRKSKRTCHRDDTISINVRIVTSVYQKIRQVRKRKCRFKVCTNFQLFAVTRLQVKKGIPTRTLRW